MCEVVYLKVSSERGLILKADLHFSLKADGYLFKSQYFPLALNIANFAVGML